MFYETKREFEGLALPHLGVVPYISVHRHHFLNYAGEHHADLSSNSDRKLTGKQIM